MSIITLAAVLLQAQPAPDLRSFPAGQRVPVEFELRERDREGGRLTPFFSHYSPSISQNPSKENSCEFHVPGKGGVRPGETRRIEMVCPFATREGASFEFFERGRPVGRAQVMRSVDQPS